MKPYETQIVELEQYCLENGVDFGQLMEDAGRNFSGPMDDSDEEVDAFVMWVMYGN